MAIRLLYIADCPSWQVAHDRLREALQVLGQVDTTVELHEVKTDTEAQELRFAGSPTIEVDGVDLLPVEGSTAFGLSCRVYRSGGQLVGTPTTERLVEALRTGHLDATRQP